MLTYARFSSLHAAKSARSNPEKTTYLTNTFITLVVSCRIIILNDARQICSDKIRNIYTQAMIKKICIHSLIINRFYRYLVHVSRAKIIRSEKIIGTIKLILLLSSIRKRLQLMRHLCSRFELFINLHTRSLFAGTSRIRHQKLM